MAEFGTQQLARRRIEASCIPAMAIAATQSGAVVPVLAGLSVVYHFVENRSLQVHGGRSRLSNIAILRAFAAKAEVGCVIGAILGLRWPRAIRPSSASGYESSLAATGRGAGGGSRRQSAGIPKRRTA
jgi:hypothetical protein